MTSCPLDKDCCLTCSRWVGTAPGIPFPAERTRFSRNWEEWVKTDRDEHTCIMSKASGGPLDRSPTDKCIMYDRDTSL